MSCYGIPYGRHTDLTPVFKDEQWSDLHYASDAHWNASGHQFLSTIIRKRLENIPLT